MSAKFGIHTFIWKKEFEGFEEEIFQQAKNWGFDGVEISTHLFESISPDKLKFYRDEYELELTICTSTPQGLSMTSNVKELWQGSIDYITKVISFCQACDITKLSGPLIHPVGYLSGSPLSAAEDKRLKEGLKQVAHKLESTNVKLALEPLNRFQGYSLNTVEQGIDILKSIGSHQIGLLLDFFHMNIEEKSIPQAILKSGNSCFHVHVCASDRGTPGSDSLNWNEVVKAFTSINYQDWVVIESFNFEDKELSKGAHLWRAIDENSFKIAENGIKFLRQAFGEMY